MTTQFNDLDEIGEGAKQALRAAVERVSEPDFPAPDFSVSLMELRGQFENGALSPANLAARQNPENGVKKLGYSDQTFHFDTKKGGVYSGTKLRGWVVYAAAALIIAIAGVKQFSGFTGTSRPTLPQSQAYSTAPAQRANITLTDGTKVTLAPATVIRVTGRNIELEGEAVFTVTSRAEDPFTVRAKGTETRVLGTRFGVKAYPGEEAVRVAVAEGKVAVASSTLSVGDVVEIRGDVSVLTRNSDVTSILAWAEGRLVFQNATASEIVATIRRWYGIEFDMSRIDLNRSYSVTLDNETRESALRVLTVLLQPED